MNRDLFKNCTKIELWFNRGDGEEGYFIKREDVKTLAIEGIKENEDTIWFLDDKFNVVKQCSCSFLRMFISKNADSKYGGNDSHFEGMSAFESIVKGQDLFAISFYDENGMFAQIGLPYEEDVDNKNIYQEVEVMRNGDLLINVSEN